MVKKIYRVRIWDDSGEIVDETLFTTRKKAQHYIEKEQPHKLPKDSYEIKSVNVY